MAIFDEKYQLITGTVREDGDIFTGEGFSSRKIKEGTYIIEFEQPFAGEVSPVCTIFGYEWRTFNMSIAILEAQPQYFICSTSTPDRPIDCNFNFTVFGQV